MTDAVMTSPYKSGIKGEHPKLRHVLGHDLWRRRIPNEVASSAAIEGNSGHSAVPPVITLFLWHPVSFGGYVGGDAAASLSKLLKIFKIIKYNGGDEGIRTLETVPRLHP